MNTKDQLQYLISIYGTLNISKKKIRHFAIRYWVLFSPLSRLTNITKRFYWKFREGKKGQHEKETHYLKCNLVIIPQRMIIDGVFSLTVLEYEIELCEKKTPENREKKWYNFTCLQNSNTNMPNSPGCLTVALGLLNVYR